MISFARKLLQHQKSINAAVGFCVNPAAAFSISQTIHSLCHGKDKEAEEHMTETSKVLELVIPFDFSGKSGIKLYRYHDDKAEALTESYSMADGTFKLDRTAELIYVYTNRFSTYAISYNNYTAYSGGEIVTEKKVKFVDVPENSYYAKAVDWAVENGITNGVDETHFAPDATCTRAQAVTFLWRALGCPEPTATESEFTDVVEGAFYFKAVLWVAENGVTNGYGDGTFGMNDTVNRAQMVTFMERAMKGKATTAESFVDVPEGSYYADAAAWAKENGMSNGVGGNKFGSNENCARAQIVTMLYRYFVK